MDTNYFNAVTRRCGGLSAWCIREHLGSDSSENAFSLLLYYRVGVCKCGQQVWDQDAGLFASLPTVTAHDLESAKSPQPIRMAKMPGNLCTDDGGLDPHFSQRISSRCGYVWIRVIETFEQDGISVRTELAQSIIEIENRVKAGHGVCVSDYSFKGGQCDWTDAHKGKGSIARRDTAIRRPRKFGEFRNSRTGNVPQQGKACRGSIGADFGRITTDGQAKFEQQANQEFLWLRRRRLILNPRQEVRQSIRSDSPDSLWCGLVQLVLAERPEGVNVYSVAINPLRERLPLVTRLVIARPKHNRADCHKQDDRRDCFPPRQHPRMMEVWYD